MATKRSLTEHASKRYISWEASKAKSFFCFWSAPRYQSILPFALHYLGILSPTFETNLLLLQFQHQSIIEPTSKYHRACTDANWLRIKSNVFSFVVKDVNTISPHLTSSQSAPPPPSQLWRTDEHRINQPTIVIIRPRRAQDEIYRNIILRRPRSHHQPCCKVSLQSIRRKVRLVDNRGGMLE